MAILDVIEFLDPTGRQIIHRVPEDGSGEFRLGSQLIVRESQAAVFFRDGKALDVFGPGRHTLSTANIPLLANLISIPFGGTSPFRAEVIFVNLADLMRVPGIAADYSELLVAAGVDTVKELKRRNPARLVARLAEVNGKKQYVEVLPSV